MIPMNSPLSKILLDSDTIATRVRELGILISSDMSGLLPCIVPVMDGGMIFAADLMREFSLPVTLLPIRASSYGAGIESSGTVRLPEGIPEEVRGRDLLLVDDILDTGRTMAVLRDGLLSAGALSVRSCVLLRKEHARHLHADYIGFEIPDSFVVGYGLDLAGLHRNLPCIGIPKL
jgi:hypoxanthine phosphoribosyltransferase